MPVTIFLYLLMLISINGKLINATCNQQLVTTTTTTTTSNNDANFNKIVTHVLIGNTNLIITSTQAIVESTYLFNQQFSAPMRNLSVINNVSITPTTITTTTTTTTTITTTTTRTTTKTTA